MQQHDVETVDDLVIGSGQGGVPLAKTLADRGRRVVLFERDRVGGSCVNFGCTPSKTLIGAAHVAGTARRGASLGVRTDVTVDGEAVMRRVRELRDAWNEGADRSVSDSAVELVRAEASFTEDGRVVGGGRSFRAERVVIDTGSRAKMPPIDGLHEVRALTDRTVWQLPRPPERLIVIGGGYIGLELGQAFARLGSEVLLLQRAERLLTREAPEVGEVLEEALRRDGVEVRTGTEAVRVEPAGDPASGSAGVHATLNDGSSRHGDALLVATGRRPNTDALNAPAAGVELTEQGHIAIDDRFASRRDGVWAIGEVAGQPPFTHVSWEDHRRLLDVWDGGDRHRNDAVVGYAVFTDPQVGRAGMSYAQAQEAGLDPRRARTDVADTARGAEWGFDLGFLEIVADGDGRLLGATVVAPEAAELVHLLQALVQLGASWRDLDRLMAIHPTFAENLPVLARQLQG